MSAPPKILCGVVVSSGKMMAAIKVRTAKQVYNKFLKKHFLTYQNHLVSDPTSSTRTGDVVRIAAEGQVSRHIQHVVTEIVAPWGPAIDERPPIPSSEERLAVKAEKRRRKLAKRGKLPKEMREGSREARSQAHSSHKDSTKEESDEDQVTVVVEGTQVAS